MTEKVKARNSSTHALFRKKSKNQSCRCRMDNSYTPEKYANNRVRRWKYTTAWSYSPSRILMIKIAKIPILQLLVCLFFFIHS